MSKEAMKLAQNVFSMIAIADNLDWVKHQAEQQAAALREALAEQPYEIGARLAREGKGISDIFGAVDSDADMTEAQRGYNEALAEQSAQQEPVAWMHEWEDGERIPLLMRRDDRNNDRPKSVRPLVFGDTSPPPA